MLKYFEKNESVFKEMFTPETMVGRWVATIPKETFCTIVFTHKDLVIDKKTVVTSIMEKKEFPNQKKTQTWKDFEITWFGPLEATADKNGMVDVCFWLQDVKYVGKEKSPFIPKTVREFRCVHQKWDRDEKKQDDVLKFTDGYIRNGISVLGNELLLSFKTKDKKKGCELADGLAVLRDALCYCGTLDKHSLKAIQYIDQAIFELDASSIENGEFKDLKEEFEYVPPYLKK
jgi:hypothetical protein